MGRSLRSLNFTLKFLMTFSIRDNAQAIQGTYLEYLEHI